MSGLETPAAPDPRALFAALADGQPNLPSQVVRDALTAHGLAADDPRLVSLARALDATDHLDEPTFSPAVESCASLLGRALVGDLVLPDFATFRRALRDVFETAASIEEGALATYIPQLARVEPGRWATSVCTVDGQRLDFGDHGDAFCVQSSMKPLNYGLALDEQGEDKVHAHVGREPSGQGFSEITLNRQGRPHNPMINAGAIMVGSLIHPEGTLADRFDHVLQHWRRCCGPRVSFDNAVFLSERSTADRNFALGYFMQEHRAFPEGTDLHEALEFYFMCCSITATTRDMSLLGATLANGGRHPLSDAQLFEPDTVRDVLSMMSSCGMYDFSGEFAFTVGLPAKSGVSGAILVVVPNVLGMVTWSPRLDRFGNSVRGLALCRALVERYNFHMFDNLGFTAKEDPRRPRGASRRGL